jgi:hypothetical protein
MGCVWLEIHPLEPELRLETPVRKLARQSRYRLLGGGEYQEMYVARRSRNSREQIVINRIVGGPDQISKMRYTDEGCCACNNEIATL